MYGFFKKKGRMIIMTKIDIFSGFLGAGKTTLIKKLIAEAYSGEKIVLIENEFGDVGVDGGFLQDAGIEITEMNSGCICCSLVGDFGKALNQVLDQYSPERILIEPSGVGKLSDVMGAVLKIERDDVKINGLTTVVDAKKCKMYMKNFGEFFNNQIESAKVVVLSHTGGMDEEKLAQVVAMIKEKNENAAIVTTDWDKLTGKDILEVLEGNGALKDELEKMMKEEDVCPVCGHHHHDHDEDGHHHHHDEDEECCHHHHDHDEDEKCHHHDHDEDGHHHHDHDEDEECCHHHHDHDEDGHHHHDEHGHHHHHADDVFTSWGKETVNKYTKEEITDILSVLADSETYGTILRAKGMVEGKDGEWIYFDYVPGEPDVRSGKACTIGRLCVIGSKINEENIAKLFRI